MPRRMPTTLRPRFRAQASGGSLLHHAPNRRPRFPRSTPPPRPSAHPSGFSIRSQQDSFGSNPTAHQRLPFVPPLPRSSIPGSATIIPYTCSCRLSEIQLISHRVRVALLRAHQITPCAPLTGTTGGPPVAATPGMLPFTCWRPSRREGRNLLRPPAPHRHAFKPRKRRRINQTNNADDSMARSTRSNQ